MTSRRVAAIACAAPWILAGILGSSTSHAESAGAPPRSVLEPGAVRGARVPDALDRAAHDLAAAALLASPADAEGARRQIETLEQERLAEGKRPSGLTPYAQYVVDATLDDPVAYREANRELLEHRDLDPALRRRLEIEVEDDPLQLASQRLADARHIKMTRWFNAFASAAGRSIMTFQAAPLRMARAAVRLAVAEHLEDPISLQERQALHHWKRYVDTHPDARASAELVQRIERTQERWFETKRLRSVRAARRGMERGHNEAALVLLERALDYAPEDREAAQLRDLAQARIAAKRRARARSLQASPNLDPAQISPAARDLAVAMLLPGADLAAAAAKAPPAIALEARFAHATALRAQGRESSMWTELALVAQRREGALSDHAARLVDNPNTNPYRAFRRALASGKRQKAGFVMLGPMARGPRELYLPRAIEWIIDGPSIIGALGGIPTRFMQTAFRSPPSRGPVPHALRYLRLSPSGEYAGRVRHWLIEHETDRKNWVGAYQLARADEHFEAQALEELAEKAAAQSFQYAERQERRDFQLALFREIAERYPETETGQQARHRSRAILNQTTTQEIRVSRGFLEENPEIAGPRGLGIRPEFLDGQKDNGELHPDGVTLTGGQTLEVALLAASGDETDPAETRHEKLNEDQLARFVAMLDETAQRNALIDPLAELKADPDRDLYFERARLGVADVPDGRPAATSHYAFLGVREKYKMVRHHEPLLPFDLVIQGSVPDLGLGAFPRLRPPRETPDAILFR